MSRIYIPTRCTGDWQRLLANPVKHWRAGYSAMALANCWEAANGLPLEIAGLLTQLGRAPELLFAVPEHKVPLSGAETAHSQNDLFAIVRAGNQTLAVTIEGKVNESFGQPVGQWFSKPSRGKKKRLVQICDLLHLECPPPSDLHYQLLHRTASAVLEARRFKTDAACMIVHSFSPTGKWFEAFARFVELYDRPAERDRLIALMPDGAPPLYVGWATGEPRFLAG